MKPVVSSQQSTVNPSTPRFLSLARSRSRRVVEGQGDAVNSQQSTVSSQQSAMNSVYSVFKFLVGFLLAIVLMAGASVAAALYFAAKLTTLPERPVFPNDKTAVQIAGAGPSQQPRLARFLHLAMPPLRNRWNRELTELW